MHDRDLAGRTTKTDEAKLSPKFQCLFKSWLRWCGEFVQVDSRIVPERYNLSFIFNALFSERLENYCVHLMIKTLSVIFAPSGGV